MNDELGKGSEMIAARLKYACEIAMKLLVSQMITISKLLKLYGGLPKRLPTNEFFIRNGIKRLKLDYCPYSISCSN